MRRPYRGAVLWAAAILVVVVALDQSVAARGGGGGGGGRGGGGFSRGGGGFNRGGPAAWGSFGQNLPAGVDRGVYYPLGPAADGNLGMQYDNRAERQQQRQERREERRDRWDDGEQDLTDRREDWQDYAEDRLEERHDDDDGDYYGDAGVYWTLPCTPNTIAMGGAIYYVCGTTWYIRAYSDGNVVYTVVPNPTGH